MGDKTDRVPSIPSIKRKQLLCLSLYLGSHAIIFHLFTSVYAICFIFPLSVFSFIDNILFIYTCHSVKTAEECFFFLKVILFYFIKKKKAVIFARRALSDGHSVMHGDVSISLAVQRLRCLQWMKTQRKIETEGNAGLRIALKTDSYRSYGSQRSGGTRKELQEREKKKKKKKKRKKKKR